MLRPSAGTIPGNGAGGIRTHETLTGLPVFKTGAFSRSATTPVGPTVGPGPWPTIAGPPRGRTMLSGSSGHDRYNPDQREVHAITPLITGMLDTLNNPAARHAALVHMPVALAFLAPLPLIASMILGKKHPTPRLAAIGAYALLALAAWLATWSGEGAYDRIGAAPGVVGTLAHDHEEMGERLWMFALVTGVLVAGGLLEKKPLALSASWLALASGVFTAGWTAATAHKGGTLVYTYGTGTPSPLTASDLDPDAAGESADPRVDFFLANVKPVLTDRCMGCHRDGRSEAGLNLTSMSKILTGAEHGPVLTPGSPQTSPIYTVLSGLHPKSRMPKTGDRLTPEQIEAIRLWIQQGAVWAE